jgi:hypothetical protein
LYGKTRTRRECSVREEIELKFWRRRPDRMVINEQKNILYLIEFKRTMDIGADLNTGCTTGRLSE